MTELLRDTQNDIISGLRQRIPEPTAKLDGSTNIVKDLKLDSLAVMDFIMALEDQFEIVIPLDRVAEVETIGDLSRVVDELRGRT
jgi:acyl carrier protein